jgi:hypothetical protein
MQLDWVQLIGALATAFAAGFGAGFSVHVVISRKSVVTQRGNRAGGDIAGGNINKRDPK